MIALIALGISTTLTTNSFLRTGSCKWTPTSGFFIRGYAAQFRQKMLFADAQAKCLELGSDVCTGITCDSWSCTVRGGTFRKSNRKEKSFSPNSACYTNKPTKDDSRMATCNQKCTSLNNKRVQMTACSVGCRHFLNGPPDSYVGAKDLKKGEAANIDLDLPKGPTDHWQGLGQGSYTDCVRACKNFACVMDADWRRGLSKVCTEPRYWATSWAHDSCASGCLAAAQTVYGATATDCPGGVVSADCRCDLSAPTNECVKGHVCTLVYGERTCHKAGETPTRDVKDELKACTQKCDKESNGWKEITCKTGCRYLLIGPPTAYTGPQHTETGSIKAIAAGPTDYWVDLAKYSSSDCHQACENFMCNQWTGDTPDCTTAVHWATGKFQSRCQRGCSIAAKIFWGDKPKACPDSATVPVSSDCRCDPKASSVDCLEGRYCFQGKCRTKWKVTAANPSDCSTECGRPKWTIFGTVTCRGNENAWQNLCMLDKPNTPKFLCPATPNCACHPAKADLPPGTQPTGYPLMLSRGDSVLLPTSSANTLLTMMRIDVDSCHTVAVARSYAGYAWEGIAPRPLHPTCDASKRCTVTLTDTHSAYRIDAVSRKQKPSGALTAARFLAQTTFGATKHDLEQFASKYTATGQWSGMKKWIDDQVAAKATLHRAYFRQRVNPRADQNQVTGTVIGPCDAMSRWHRFAFSIADEGKVLKISRSALTKNFVLSIDGLVRTEVPETWQFSPYSRNGNYRTADIKTLDAKDVQACHAACAAVKNCKYFSWFQYLLVKRGQCYLSSSAQKKAKTSKGWLSLPVAIEDPGQPIGEYKVMQVQEAVGQALVLCPAADAKECAKKKEEKYATNPLIHFSSPDKEVTQVYSGSVGSDVLTPLFPRRDSAEHPKTDVPDVYIMKSPRKDCQQHVFKAGASFIGFATSKADATLQFYKHDPRLRLLENTLDSPADISAARDAGHFGRSTAQAQCPLVTPNFLNEGKCVRHTEGTCSPLEFVTDARVTLDRTNLRLWYTTSHKHVLAVDGLKLEKSAAVSPCKANLRSRWRLVPGKCEGGPTLDDATAKTLTAALTKHNSGCESFLSKLPEDERSYSSVWGNFPPGLSYARSRIDGPQGWSAGKNQAGEWMQFDFGEVRSVAGVVVQPRKGSTGQYVKSYTVQHSLNGNEWFDMPGVFNGHKKDKKTSYFPAAVSARYLRLVVTKWQKSISMRADVLLCRYGGGKNPHIRDVVVSEMSDGTCSNSIGARVQVGDHCWHHVHPDTLNVYDFSSASVLDCPSFLSSPKRNKINSVAEGGSHVMQYTDTVTEWDALKLHGIWFGSTNAMTLRYVGRFGDTHKFENLDPNLQTIAMAEALGVKSTKSTVAFDACGSRAEVANDPMLGNMLFFDDDRCLGVSENTHKRELDIKHNLHRGKEMVFTNIVMKAPDQLRQRVAWALSQIFVISQEGLPRNHLDMAPFFSYYDILVDNAFGNYRDIMKEVAFHPLMGKYLTYYGNKAFGYTKTTYPDENFAREFMQLFSIGLLNRHPDGSPKLDKQNSDMPTYNSDHIMAFARVWTGMTRENNRGNREKPFGNDVDPMVIRYDWHDFLPKINLNLDGGHLGDGYPLCADHPRAFLAKGARYRYTGDTSDEGIEFDRLWYSDERPRFAPSKTSKLFQTLCKRDSSTGKCTFPSLVVLPHTLKCNGAQECQAENVRVVKIVDGDRVGYFTHVPPRCARLTFFNGVMTYTPERWSRFGAPQCTDPTSTVMAGAACCDSANEQIYPDWGKSKCLFSGETMSLKTAQARCATDHPDGVQMKVCPANVFSRKQDASKYSCSPNGYMWTTESCRLRVKIFSSGKVMVVSPTGTDTQKQQLGSKYGITQFMVHWTKSPSSSDQIKPFPTHSTGCAASGCTVVDSQGGSCLCDITITENAVYTDTDKIPDAEKLLSTLFIGAPAPSDEPGVYTLCTSCGQQTGVTVYIRGSNGSPAELEDTAVFAIDSGAGKVTYLMNRRSMVGVGQAPDGSGSLFSFRNPPNLMPGVGETWPATNAGWNSVKMRTAMVTNEIDALIDHVASHDNTAVFVARKLIMRLITSNPSPRYIQTVSTAFKTGTYGGRKFSGQHGDLEATVHAVLLDPEARNSMLDYDMTFGRVREPLLKLLQVMRVLEYKSRDEREIVMQPIGDKIGQQIFRSATVFNFFEDDFDALGPMFAAGLVAPETQLLTAPQTIAWLNGMTSLINYGLSSCQKGFAEWLGYGQTCGAMDIARAQSQGWLTFTPKFPSNPAATLEELSLLLTSGRLTPQHRSVIQQAYAQVLGVDGEQAALQRALKLIIFSAEFHNTAMNTLVPANRPVGPPETSHDRKFKAVVVVFMAGGADTFNLLVPHSKCKGSVDLYKEYESVRGPDVAIPKDQLLEIEDPDDTQPCSVMGLHPNMPFLKELYDDGDAVMVANMGALVEPITKEEFLKKKKKLPPGLFAHNLMQKNAQTVNAQNSAAQGVLARMFDALQQNQNSPPYKSNLFSLAGSKKILSGSSQVFPDIVSPNGGITRYNEEEYEDLKGDITKLLGHSHSLLSETYASEMENILKSTEKLGPILSNQPLSAPEPWKVASPDVSNFGAQLREVAKLIKISKTEQFVERSGYVTQMGRFDTHNDAREVVNENFNAINVGLKSFVNELKAQKVWDDVVVVAMSDFGRKLPPNGLGTDHAWGGNYFVLGGGIRGGHMLGEFPSRLHEEHHVRGGRVIPTTPWEAVWHGVAQWLDVEDHLIPNVVPNEKRFDPKNIFTRWELFDENPPAAT